jgi:hypothetical protein
MNPHPYYNTVNFPHFVCHNGNWDIYKDDCDYCASIPTTEAAAQGCKASHFGDLKYTQITLNIDPTTGERRP